MNTFKNGVGRPSNEILRKRKILKGLLIIIVFNLIIE